MNYRLVQVRPFGGSGGVAGEEQKVPAGVDRRGESPQRFPQTPPRPVALDGSADAPPGAHTEAAAVEVIAASHQNDKRVRIRLARTPHPLKVLRTGEPVPAIHPPEPQAATA